MSIRLTLGISLSSGGQGGGGYDAVTSAHVARVIADSGVVSDIPALDAIIADLRNLALLDDFYALWLFEGGHKISTGASIAKWYDIIGSNDLLGDTVAQRPQLGVNTVNFLPISPTVGLDLGMYLRAQFSSEISLPHTYIYVNNGITLSRATNYVFDKHASYATRNFIIKTLTGGFAFNENNSQWAEQAADLAPLIMIGFAKAGIGKYELWRNGLQKTSTSGGAGAAACNGITLGVPSTLTNSGYSMNSGLKLFGISKANATIITSAAKRIALEDYLSTKYGITLERA